MTASENPALALVDLASVFSRETIVMIPHGADKPEALNRLVQALEHAGRLPFGCTDSVVETLLARECCGTTGLGKGLALPHLRCRAVTDFVGAIGLAPTGVDFDSLDGLPTRLILLVVSPFDRREEHVEVMARLAKLLSDETLQYSMQIPRSPEALFRFLGF